MHARYRGRTEREIRRIPGALGILLLLLGLTIAPSCQSLTGDDPPTVGIDPEPPTEARGFRAIGYHPWWTGDSWMQYDFSSLDAVYFFALEPDASGLLSERRGWPESWQALITAADVAGVPVVPTVAVLQPDTFRAVFGTDAVADVFVSEVENLIMDPATSGLHLDFEIFEAVSPEIRDRVTAVVRRLRETIDENRPGFELTLFLLAEDPGESFDESALAAAADLVIVQGYDLHWIGGAVAGPLAPLEGWSGRNWISVMARLGAAGVPPEKIIFSVPYYGYEWPTESDEPGSRTRGWGIELTYAPSSGGLPSARDRAAHYGKRRDPTSGSPYYVWRDSTGWRQGWFEDDVSLAAKYAFIRGRGLAGAAVFPLAYGDDALFSSLAGAKAAGIVSVR